MVSLSLYSKLKIPNLSILGFDWLSLFDTTIRGIYCAQEYLMIWLARTKLLDELCSTGEDKKGKVILHLEYG